MIKIDCHNKIEDFVGFFSDHCQTHYYNWNIQQVGEYCYHPIGVICAVDAFVEKLTNVQNKSEGKIKNEIENAESSVVEELVADYLKNDKFGLEMRV